MDTHATQEILGLVLAIAEDIEAISSQQLSGFSAVLKFIPLIPKIGPALRDINLVIPEYKDLTDVERVELKAYVHSNFTLIDKDTEVIIEQALDVAIDLSQLVQALTSPPVVPAVQPPHHA